MRFLYCPTCGMPVNRDSTDGSWLCTSGHVTLAGDIGAAVEAELRGGVG